MNRFNQFRECLLGGRRGLARLAPLAARLPAFVGGRGDAVDILRGLRVAVVGLGSVGMRIAEHFARLQVAELWLVDPRRCKPESMLTHPITRLMDLPKATFAARLCKRISPRTRVFAFVGLVQDLWLDAFADAHLCVMATDNLAAEVEFGRRCLSLGKRLVHAALHGDTLTVQVRVYDNADGQGPCPACSFGATEWQLLAEQVQFSCDGSASASPAPRISAPPTISTSSLCSQASDLALNQSLRLALGLGEAVGDTIVEYCGFTNRMLTSRLVRNPDCRGEHVRFALVRARAPLRSYSFARLASEFLAPPGDRSATLTVGGVDWIERGLCGCAEPPPVQRFVSAGRGTAGRCGRCRTLIHTQPFTSHQTIPASMLGPVAAVPLGLLGVRKSPFVLLRGADAAVLVQDPRRVLPLP
ncbi:MAG TPA: ThiF family adenylyltransferase [Candidatus Paceibacterota bacterium]|nr:ThiF family adenylyltransferase [Verrucomicrobiota bacterium]HSA11016.1 ThiF family adenylyltransferase [Candidatus Paceibacterota bacterium]